MRKLKHVLSRVIETLYYTPKRFIKNVWFFRKELSQWWNWDQEPTLRLLKRALEGMYIAHRDDSYHEGSERIAKEIKICIHLLDRIIEDDYFFDKFDYTQEETTHTIVSGQTLRGFKMNVQKKHDLPSASMRHKIDLKKQDTELLFKIMSRKINGWWC